MNHVVLLGDSIFDNERYVPGDPAVIEQLRRALPGGWRATLLGRDGAVTADVVRQLEQLPGDATHLIVSADGNDALEQNSLLLREAASSFAEVLSQLADIRGHFQHDYRTMLDAALERGRPLAVCTIYDCIPGLDRIERTGLCLFNDVIIREAVRCRLPEIDLRLVCTEFADYSSSSPIVPSRLGGAKIAAAISRLVTSHDSQAGCRVFV